MHCQPDGEASSKTDEKACPEHTYSVGTTWDHGAPRGGSFNKRPGKTFLGSGRPQSFRSSDRIYLSARPTAAERQAADAGLIDEKLTWTRRLRRLERCCWRTASRQRWQLLHSETRHRSIASGLVLLTLKPSYPRSLARGIMIGF
jgi:hypothetical protein